MSELAELYRRRGELLAQWSASGPEAKPELMRQLMALDGDIRVVRERERPVKPRPRRFRWSRDGRAAAAGRDA